MTAPGVLYACEVMHRSYRSPAYRFRYRVFSLLIDIDRLDELHRMSPWLSVDRFNLFSFYRRDHLAQGRTDLRQWCDQVLRQHDIDPQGLRVRLLCMPRVLGWGFDPLSIWYCETEQGEPVAAIGEVHNTFGERHCYLLRAPDTQWPLRSQHNKLFHVSPFMEVSGQYAFVLGRPDQRLRVAIVLSRDAQPLLSATQLGERRPLNSRQLWRFFVRVPWQTAKVLGGIHWHALKIWLRGAPFFRKPQPPFEEVS